MTSPEIFDPEAKEQELLAEATSWDISNPEQFHETTTAETVDRTVSQDEVDDFYQRLVKPRLTGVRPTVSHRTVCLYTNTIDDHFLVDRHPQSEHIMLASPCSGHGFKHSTALAEALVGHLSGASDVLSIEAFVR